MGSLCEGRLSPSSTSVVAANSDTVARGIVIAVSGSLKSALLVESTGSDISAWPAALTIWFCSLSIKPPLRVYTFVPSVVFRAKKPSPVIARSREFAENSMLPWLNSCTTSLSDTPAPTTDEAFWSGDVAKISPKSAVERLKPEVPAFAILFEVTASSVVAALRPVSEV